MLSFLARVCAASVVLLAACQPVGVPGPRGTSSASAEPSSAPRVAAGSSLELTGAGSTFDNPLFSQAFAAYNQVHPTIQVNYQSVGSGAGIQQLIQGTVDFGASDAPLTDDQMQEMGGTAVDIPVTLGAVALGYNLPGVPDGLTLSGDVLARIYLGRITQWNDPSIAALNPAVRLPATPIAPVERSDGSGTTDLFTTFLALESSDWASRVGAGLSVDWPVGIGGEGSEGVAGQVKQIPGAIGYFELAYALSNAIPSASIQMGGETSQPSLDGAARCAASVADDMPTDLRVGIAGCQGQGAYPLADLSWIIIRQRQTDPARAQALVDLLWWLIHTGQQYATPSSYAPLPASLVALDEHMVQSITVDGQSVVPAES